jgi:hypothetical protein
MWEIFPTFVNNRSGLPASFRQKRRFSAISAIWHGVCNNPGMVPDDPVPLQGE